MSVCHDPHGNWTPPQVKGIKKLVAATRNMALPTQSTRLSFCTIEPGTSLSRMKEGTIMSDMIANGILIRNIHLCKVEPIISKCSTSGQMLGPVLRVFSFRYVSFSLFDATTSSLQGPRYRKSHTRNDSENRLTQLAL